MPLFRNKINSRLLNFLLIAVVAVAMVFLMLKVTSALKTHLMEQRFMLITQTAEIRCSEGIIDLDNFGAFFNHLDQIYNVFAAVYSSEFEIVTQRHPDILIGRTIKFSPFEHTEILEALNNKDSGSVIVPFTVVFDKGNQEIYPTPLHFWKVDYNDSYVIAMVATPFIEDTITLPDYYYPILYSIFITVLSVVVILIIIKL